MKIESYIPNYFYYVCPKGLIKLNEIQQFAGLIYVHDNHLEIIKKAKILHRFKHDTTKIFKKFCRVKSEREYLGSCLLTYKNNESKKYYEKHFNN